MQKLKPMTILALDPHAAAFCAAVRGRLARDFGARGRLIQTHVLINDGQTLRFESDLDSVADPRFDLQAARAEAQRMTADEAHALFERERANLEPPLINMLETGRNATEIDAARRENIDIVRQRMIFLLFSSSDPFARGVALDLTRQIRWLFATRFSQEQFFLQAVVLLPGLFEKAEPPDYAATYDLLKKLDYSISEGLFVTALLKNVSPFEGCWLLDGSNARGDKIGSLAEKLDSYSDAFVGFLTAEPEMSGALLGTRVSRGKTPAYSAFGHGELYFPVETMLRRLSSALASDIITRAFLAEEPPRADTGRQLLLAAKEFVLSADYGREIDGLEKRDKGGAIWEGFKPRVELREGMTQEHVSELQRLHAKFERETLPGLQRLLLTRSEEVKAKLEELVDTQVRQRANSTPDGLTQAAELLETMTDAAIALRRDVLGERPQNLVTAQRELAGYLDQRLGVTPDHTQTEALLDRVQELRSRLFALQTTLRLTATVPRQSRATEQSKSAPAAQAEAGGEASGISAEEKKSLNPEEERQRLGEEIADAEHELDVACSDYQHAIIAEDRMAYQLRHEASKQVREKKAQATAAAEQEVITVGAQLREARRVLDELQQERRQFLMRNFVVNPLAAVLLLFGVPFLAALADFGPARAAVNYFWEHLSNFLLGLLIIALVYAAIMLYLFMVGINRRVNEARNQVKQLESGQRTAVVQLTRARDDQLRLEYQLYEQNIRIDTLNHLIEAVRRRAQEIKETLAALVAMRDAFDLEHKEAAPLSSATRRPVLSASDIDAFYEKRRAETQLDVGTFVRDFERAEALRIAMSEFKAKLETFARSRFERLRSLTIEDVLLREPELLAPENATRQLRELDDAAEPLVQLREIGIDDDHFAQRDVTLWAGAEEHEQLLARYRQICPNATARPSEDERTLRALTRCLNYPAYFLGQIDYYRACYDRTHDKETTTLPDLIPAEYGSGAEVQRAHEKLLLAIALGLVLKKEGGGYGFAGTSDGSFGLDRKVIAEQLATEFNSQRLYADLCERVEAHATDHQVIHQKLVAFLDSSSDLNPAELDIMNSLLRKYHPLR
ncbi:MAG TPA: hypothetical protein VGC89_20235 [Pyrinomonadaceae bacterium]